MSKFFDLTGTDDRHGQRRAADWEYSGGVGKLPPSGIEKKLIEAGMPAKEAEETGPAIVKRMGQLKDATPDEQQKMVRMFMGRFGDDQTASAITKMARGEPVEVKKAPVAPRPPAMR